MLEKISSCKRGGRSAFWRGKGALFLLVIFSVFEENHVDLEKKNQRLKRKRHQRSLGHIQCVLGGDIQCVLEGRFRVIPEKDSTHSGGF